MKTGDMVSVIIPAYNCESTILDCIQSITSQNYINIEVIVVNDGSSDNTENVVKKAAEIDARITLVNQPNRGVSSARNHGIEKSRGAFISFVDSDDRLIGNAISCMIDLFAENVDASLVQGVQKYADREQIKDESTLQTWTACVSASEFKTVALNRFSYTDNNWGLSATMIQSVHGCYGKLFKKDIIIHNQLQFDETLGLGEDLLFYLNYLEHSEDVVITSEPVYFINENIGSSTRGFNKKMPCYANLMIDKLLEKKLYDGYKEVDICDAILKHIGVAIQAYYSHPDNKESMIKRCSEFGNFIKENNLKEELQHSATLLLTQKEASNTKDKLLLKLLSSGWFRTYCFIKCVNRQVRG